MRFIASTREFFVGVRSEMKKVTWTTRKELKDSTVVVIAVTLIIAAAVGAIDQVFQQGLLGKYGLFAFLTRGAGG